MVCQGYRNASNKRPLLLNPPRINALLFMIFLNKRPLCQALPPINTPSVEGRLFETNRNMPPKIKRYVKVMPSKSLTLVKKKQNIEGATKSYFTQSYSVVIILFKRIYVGLRFLPIVLENQFFVFLCFLWFLFKLECF